MGVTALVAFCTLARAASRLPTSCSANGSAHREVALGVRNDLETASVVHRARAAEMTAIGLVRLLVGMRFDPTHPPISGVGNHSIQESRRDPVASKRWRHDKARHTNHRIGFRSIVFDGFKDREQHAARVTRILARSASCRAIPSRPRGCSDLQAPDSHRPVESLELEFPEICELVGLSHHQLLHTV